jgi:hypothetical protein
MSRTNPKLPTGSRRALMANSRWGNSEFHFR